MVIYISKTKLLGKRLILNSTLHSQTKFPLSSRSKPHNRPILLSSHSFLLPNILCFLLRKIGKFRYIIMHKFSKIKFHEPILIFRYGTKTTLQSQPVTRFRTLNLSFLCTTSTFHPFSFTVSDIANIKL